MERLKKLLRQALQEQGQRLVLQDGQAAVLLTASGDKVLDAAERVDAAYVQKLYAFLFPHDKTQLAAGQMTKGALNVPNVGKVLLIAQPTAPVGLRLYLPPQGAGLFDGEWASLNQRADPTGNFSASPTSRPPAALTPPPPRPPVGAIRTPLASTVPAPAVQPIPPPDMGGGFVPLKFATDLVSESDLEVAQVMAPAAVSPPSVVIPSAAPGSMPAMPAMPVSMGMAIDMDADVSLGFAPNMNAESLVVEMPRAPAPISPRPAPRLEMPQGDYAGRTAPAEVAKEISFAAEPPGSASSSDGQNPIDAILTDMVKRKASDVHMTSGEPICMRIDGEIQRITNTPVTADQMRDYLMPMMPDRNRNEFADCHDTDFAYELRGVGRFRVNIFRDRNGVGTVMRHIPSKILTAEQLNLPPAITKFCNLTKGLVLVTGPTGSGKSTTLAAMIDLINKTRHDHILTIEDPIEFTHPQQKCLVNQREVHRHTGSFSRALRAALREDPDIVLIGEMRDLETVAIAIETAETGHLVFGTLHTTTAVSTIDRIVDQFPTTQQEQIRMMLANSLRGVVAQTLLKKKGGGRVAAHEILVTTDAVSAMVREGKNHMIPNHMQSQRQDGNILLNESLLKLVKDGVVDADDAMRKAVDKTTLLEMYKRSNIKSTEISMAPPPKPGAKQSA